MAVPVRVVAEHKVVREFERAGATSMADAMAYETRHPARRRAFERLKGLDILRTDGTGKWWLDEHRWEDRRAGRRGRAIFALLAVGIAAAVAALR